MLNIGIKTDIYMEKQALVTPSANNILSLMGICISVVIFRF
jgi:hypothetical protein